MFEWLRVFWALFRVLLHWLLRWCTGECLIDICEEPKSLSISCACSKVFYYEEFE